MHFRAQSMAQRVGEAMEEQNKVCFFCWFYVFVISVAWKTVRDSEVSKNHLITIHAAAAKSLQSCLTLCDPIDGSPPGSPVPGILQARTLE